jgi:hypothetical protein
MNDPMRTLVLAFLVLLANPSRARPREDRRPPMNRMSGTTSVTTSGRSASRKRIAPLRRHCSKKAARGSTSP